MPNTKFITDILNLEESLIDKCDSFKSDDGTITFIIKLHNTTFACPLCGSESIVSNVFYKKKLNHSTLKIGSVLYFAMHIVSNVGIVLPPSQN